MRQDTTFMQDGYASLLRDMLERNNPVGSAFNYAFLNPRDYIVLRSRGALLDGFSFLPFNQEGVRDKVRVERGWADSPTIPSYSLENPLPYFEITLVSDSSVPVGNMIFTK